MKDHVRIPLSIGECRRVLGSDAVKEILGEGGLPQEYAGGIVMPHVLRQMLIAWAKQGRPDPVNDDTDTMSRFTLDFRQKWHDGEKAKKVALEAHEQIAEQQIELEKLRMQVMEIEQLKRDSRINETLYREKRKQHIEQKHLSNTLNSRLILYRGRYGDRFMGELNWFQRFIARLFCITGKRS